MTPEREPRLAALLGTSMVKVGMLKEPVALDELLTWPQGLLDLLEQNSSVLQQHAEFDERRYDGLRNGASPAQLQARLNPFSDARESLLADVKRMLRGASVVAWHCTRLTTDELEGVRREGLRCLDRNAMRQKIATRADAGDLNRNHAARLVNLLDARAADACRSKKLWAVLSKLALKDEHGLSQPLTYWGGEALLRYDDGDTEVLSRLGTACIVEFSAPVASAVVIDVVEPFVQRFLYLKRGHGEDGAADVCFNAPVAARAIRRVVTRRAPDFEYLTSCSTWSTELT